MTHYILLCVHEIFEREGSPEQKRDKRISLEALEDTLSKYPQLKNTKENLQLDRHLFLLKRDDNLAIFSDIVSTLNTEKIPYSILYFETENEWQDFNKN
jgi:hypothetical protein